MEGKMAATSFQFNTSSTIRHPSTPPSHGSRLVVFGFADNRSHPFLSEPRAALPFPRSPRFHTSSRRSTFPPDRPREFSKNGTSGQQNRVFWQLPQPDAYRMWSLSAKVVFMPRASSSRLAALAPFLPETRRRGFEVANSPEIHGATCVGVAHRGHLQALSMVALTLPRKATGDLQRTGFVVPPISVFRLREKVHRWEKNGSQLADPTP
ncbi:hypothetical protein F5144DRAFT_365838 [Chaetomium tenue]|uniref:Uncharacterized protein n=1 Tax=Chaetomium tenue TaxID=1854479 RepID=A0ACB7NZE7_9PEZI|nr:hypothetical protein F5144DRAFT_365838 [Chaetomium globosum]